MECYRHSGVVSAAKCVACSQPICEECREDVAGHAMCRPCVVAAQARLSSEPGLAAPMDAGAAAGPADEAVPAAASSDAGAGSAASVQPASAQPAAAAKEFVRPGIGRRLVRGLLWGAIYGQWWTLFTIISPFIW